MAGLRLTLIMIRIVGGKIGYCRGIWVVCICGGLLVQNLAGAATGVAAAIIDDCLYVDDAAAQANWKPMQGTPPALAAGKPHSCWRPRRPE